MEVNNGGIDNGGERREKKLEIGEERRVVEGPWAGGVGVPVRERERVGGGEPIAVNFEICAVVRWD